MASACGGFGPEVSLASIRRCSSERRRGVGRVLCPGDGSPPPSSGISPSRSQGRVRRGLRLRLGTDLAVAVEDRVRFGRKTGSRGRPAQPRRDRRRGRIRLSPEGVRSRDRAPGEPGGVARGGGDGVRLLLPCPGSGCRIAASGNWRPWSVRPARLWDLPGAARLDSRVRRRPVDAIGVLIAGFLWINDSRNRAGPPAGSEFSSSEWPPHRQPRLRRARR